MEGKLEQTAAAATTIDVPATSRRTRGLALTRRAGTVVVLTSASVWAVGFAVLGVQRHQQYASARFDLGNMVQAVWNTAHGHFLDSTLGTGEQASRLASHVDPILALFAPAAFFLPAAEVLIVAQAFVLAAGAWPVLALARRHLESEVAAVFLGLTYLVYPWIAWETQTDFHPVALAITFFLFAVWFLDARRYVAFGVAAGLALLCGELMGLPLLGLGLWHAVSTRRWRAGAAIAAVGAAWTALCIWIVIPAAAGSHSPFYHHFHKVGGSPGGLLEKTLTDPGAVAGELLTAADLRYLVLLGLPLLGMFLGAPLILLAAAPQLAVNMLSAEPAMTSVKDHYVSAVAPFLFAATVLGLARFGRRRVMVASLIFETSLVLGIAFGPWPSLALPETAYRFRAHREPANRAAALEAIARVPDGAAVASTNAAGAHLSERRYYYSVPVLGRAEWVLIDRRDPWIPYDPARPSVYGPLPKRLAAFERGLQRSREWRVVFERGDVVLYRRGAEITQ